MSVCMLGNGRIKVSFKVNKIMMTKNGMFVGKGIILENSSNSMYSMP